MIATTWPEAFETVGVWLAFALIVWAVMWGLRRKP